MALRFLAGLLAVGSILFALGSPSLGQPGGGGFKDPKAMFERMANGKDFITISEVNPFFRERLVKFAQDNRITNDRLTFEQYKVYMEQRSKEWGSKKGGEGFKKGGKGFGSEGGRSGLPQTPTDPVAPKAEEKPAPAKPAESAPEYSTRVIIEADLDRRPVVYRSGKLPSGLPEWFKELDLDNDGQVDLGEWRKAGRAIADFRAIDVNNDGLLTPEEVLRYQTHGDKGSTDDESESEAPAGGPKVTSSGSGKKSESGSQGSFFQRRKKSSR